MSEEHNIVFNLNIDVEESVRELRRIETILYRYLGLMRRFGLPENIDEAVMRIQRLIAVLNLLRATLIAVQAASGPIGWLGAGAGALATIYGVADLAMDLG